MRLHSHTLEALVLGGVRLALSSQTVWQGEQGWCTFTAEILPGRGAFPIAEAVPDRSERHDQDEICVESDQPKG